LKELVEAEMSHLTITSPVAADKPDWRRLYYACATFYKVPMNDAIADRVWGWINNPAHILEALVARNDLGETIGLAHFRAVRRPARSAAAKTSC
jgi:hypothetical protein